MRTKQKATTTIAPIRAPRSARDKGRKALLRELAVAEKKLAALSSPFHLASRAHQRQARLVEKLRWRLSTLAHLPPGGPQLYPLTFTIDDNGTSITCKRCERTSHSQGDVEQHYCSHCKMFHDDIWPPAREWWINSYSE